MNEAAACTGRPGRRPPRTGRGVGTRILPQIAPPARSRAANPPLREEQEPTWRWARIASRILLQPWRVPEVRDTAPGSDGKWRKRITLDELRR